MPFNIGFPPSVLSPYFTIRRGIQILEVNDIKQILGQDFNRVAIVVSTFASGHFTFSPYPDNQNVGAVMFLSSNAQRWVDSAVFRDFGTLIGGPWWVHNTGPISNVGWIEILYRPPPVSTDT